MFIEALKYCLVQSELQCMANDDLIYQGVGPSVEGNDALVHTNL